jgi:hypothetical protein
MSYPYNVIVHSAPPMTANHRHGIPTTAGAPAPMQGSSAEQPADWQARAMIAYRHVQRHALTVLPELLATRVSALTGRSIDAEDVFVDLDAELAIVVVDGVVFRARNQQVVVLRSCVECGIARFESAPLYSRADLGYALSVWQPHCRSCQPEDPANWLES